MDKEIFYFFIIQHINFINIILNILILYLHLSFYYLININKRFFSI